MAKRIILYNPKPAQNEVKTDVSLGLLSIASIPYNEGYDIKYVNNNNENALQKVLEYSKGALCICFGVMTGYQIKDALIVSKAVKEKYPDLKVVWGGWHPSILPDETIKNENIDIIVIGQGQKTFYELIGALSNNKPLDGINGIMYKENGQIKKNPARAFEDINNFPPVPYELIEEEQKLTRNSDDSKTKVMFYYTSQGCPHRCKFCADPLVYKHKTSMLTAERVLGDIERFVGRYNITGVQCIDTNFFVNEKRVKEIAEGLSRKNINIKWECLNGRTNHLLKMQDETWKALKKMDVSYVLVGAESGNEETLKYIQKDTTVKDTIELTKKCKEYGLKVRYTFMLGLPPNPDIKEPYSEQIEREWDSLVDIINNITSISKENSFAIQIYAPYPGSPFYDICLKNGFKQPQNLEEWGDFTYDKAVTPWMPKKYKSLVHQLNVLYIPFITGQIYNKLEKYKALGKIAKYAFYPLEKAVLFRWKHRIYSIPVEYYLVKLSEEIARKRILKNKK